MAYSITLAFPLLEPDVLLAEPDAWHALEPYLPLIQAPDMGGPKGCGEWLLAGSSFAGANALRSWEPDVQIGQSHKRLRVLGPRRWEHGTLSEPLPVGSVAMDWRSAWGGAAIAENPVGCGVRDGSDAITVPCIEHSEHRWSSPDESSRPACTLPLDVAHPWRRRFAGTYDASYLERFYPGMPADFDHRFFNRAPVDQQIPGLWRGDEAFVLRHWHAERSCIEGRLPGLRPALHVALHGEPLQRVDMGLSTVWLFPNALFGLLVFEGWIPVRSLDGSEIERMIAGVERLEAAAHPLEHYERLWHLRTEHTPKAAAFALDDSNLCPPGVVTRFAVLDEATARSKPHPALEKMGDRMARQWEQALELLPKVPHGPHQVTQGENPGPVAGAGSDQLVPVVAGLSNMFRGMAELSRKKLDLHGKKPYEQIEASERFQDETKRRIKALTAEYESIMQTFTPRPNGQDAGKGLASMALPPDPSGKAALVAKLAQDRPAGESLTISTGELKALTAQLDAQSMRDHWDQLDGLIAQNLELRESPDEMARAQRCMKRLRQQVAAMGDSEADGAQRLAEMVKAYAAMPGGVTMPSKLRDGEDWDDYTQRVLKEAKPPQFEPLNEEYLVAPDVVCAPGLRLRNRTVGGWRLRGHDLRGANLENMTLIGCDLRDCTFSDSVWHNCTLIGCDMRGAKLDKAQIKKTRFQWCCLNKVMGAHSQWESTQFLYGFAKDSDWQHSQWTAGSIVETDFNNSNWRSSEITREAVLKVPFGEAQFSEFQATRSTWIECRLEDSTWNSCVLKGCYLGDSNLPKSWRDASLIHVSFRSATLNATDWRNAKLDGVDCGEAKMQDCDCSGLRATNLHALNADLRNSNFEGAHITGGLFIDSDLRGTRFINAIMEHCSFGLARQNDQTDFTGADLSGSNFHPKREEEPR